MPIAADLMQAVRLAWSPVQLDSHGVVKHYLERARDL